MKYIHGREIKGKASGSGIVRIVFGSLLAITYLIVLISEFTSYYVDPAMIIVYTLTAGAGAALLLLFGIRGLKLSLKTIPMRDPNRNEPMDPVNPFFTVTCPTCATKFDYQKSDLGFRAWYPNGYVVCPGCGNNIRHNAQANAYESFGEDVYIYPNN